VARYVGRATVFWSAVLERFISIPPATGMKARRRVTIAIGVALLLSPPNADAQGARATRVDSARVDGVRPDSAPLLDRVMVTATRFRHRLLDLSLAATIVDSAVLRNTRGYGLDEALRSVPGVLAQSRYGGSDVRITIRGFGSRGAGDRSNAGTSRGIRVLLDGIPETEPDGRTSFDLIDLATVQQAEVIRSNASALWGNAAGGVINLSTVPEVAHSRVSLQQMAGDFGQQRTIVGGARRLGRARLYGSYINTGFDGWRAHSDSRRVLVNLGADVPLGDRSTLLVVATATNHLFHVPGPLTRAQTDSAPEQANAVYALRDERRYDRLARLGATFEVRPDSMHGLSAMIFGGPKYLERSERGTYRDFERYHVGGNLVYRQTDALAASVRSTVVAGTDAAYQDGAIRFYSLTAAGTRGDDVIDDKREGANNLGVFIEDELAFGHSFVVSLGARYDRITYYYDNYITPSIDARRDFTGVTPKVGILYRFMPTTTVYLNVGGGVEAPAGNETDPASTFGQDSVTAINPLLDPIRSTTYEFGTRREIAFGGRWLTSLTYDAALYLTDVRNEIVPYRGGRFYFTAGRARRRGAELAASVRGAFGLSLDGSLTRSENRYIDYSVDSVHYGVAGRFADYSDNKVVGVPDQFYSASLGIAPSRFRGVALRVTVDNVGSYYADDANAVRVPAHTLLGATVALNKAAPIGSGLALRGFVSVANLTNLRYIGSSFLNPDIVNKVPVAFEPGLPRTILVSLSVVRER
jgi:iron complex outermembrane receptor protein